MENGIINDEQSAYRKMRTCIDNAYILTTIVRNRRAKKLSTYVCFVNFSSAFDKINHVPLIKSLIENGINGQFCRVIQSLYRHMYAAVSVCGYITSWFTLQCSIRQGDVIAPTLFNLHINNLVDDIKSVNYNLKFGNVDISILIYADDVLLISDKLQTMLNELSDWCFKWRMSVNKSKSNILHFRPNNCARLNTEFMFQNIPLQTMSHYRYMGLELKMTLWISVTLCTPSRLQAAELWELLHINTII